MSFFRKLIALSFLEKQCLNIVLSIMRHCNLCAALVIVQIVHGLHQTASQAPICTINYPLTKR